MSSETQPPTFQLGFIGAGKLAGSVIRGLLLKGVCMPRQIIASEPNDELRQMWERDAGICVTADNMEVAQRATVVLIGVKPGVVLPVIQQAAPALSGKVVVSLAAGTRLASMEALGDARFMRVMTNIPSALGDGASALARGSRTTDEDVEQVRTMFGAIGVIVEVAEDQIDAVTALAGSGPAFVYSVIEALAQGGEREGLPPGTALALATSTVLGAARYASASNATPEELRRMVITPGGTTAAGLAAMERLGTTEGLIAAVQAAAERGREMAAS
ncbi:MAG TPA: pyrroline-5-carboxylate reductase [Chthoniobacterales bacterium]|nr:pyrroline-5-carboxylate reductase [Chthoniobacterales bacterium]